MTICLCAHFFSFSIQICWTAARGNRPLRDQVCMRHFPFLSDGSTFPRTRFGFFSGHRNFIPKFADLFVMLQAGNFGADAYHSIWHRGFHVTLTICQCAQFFSFSIQLRWRATARRGVVHCLKKTMFQLSDAVLNSSRQAIGACSRSSEENQKAKCSRRVYRVFLMRRSPN